MGLFDMIKGVVSDTMGSSTAEGLPSLINQHYPGGLNGMLGQLQKSGYGQQVASWLGHGANDPIDVDDLRNALNNEHVRMIAEKLGLPADQLLGQLANALPQAVDEHSPDGQLQSQLGDRTSSEPAG